MGFMIGCNYWASNAGTEMWCDWDENAVREDIRILSENGVRYLRVFPTWRDFQPIFPVYEGGMRVREYWLEGNRKPTNPYYIDDVMQERFSIFCDICEEYDMKLIVAILTGFMSGRMLIPAALYDKNLFTDHTALYFEEKFIKGIVSMNKHRSCIHAWETGNECNTMSGLQSRFSAEVWTAFVVNAVKACDPTRPFYAGMHGLKADRGENQVCWTIKGQAEFCDMLTTHPYPLWVEHSYKGRFAQMRRGIQATAQTKYYADLSGKPCLVEEIGTMGPAFGDDETVKDYVRVALLSNWAHGASGFIWWCGCEQVELNFPPYSWNQAETELGLIGQDRLAKPQLVEMGRLAKLIKDLPFTLPAAKEDAVCILTKDQNHWGVAYMTYLLAKQAGLTLRFAYCDDELPASDLYLVPSSRFVKVMDKENYLALKKKAAEGATVYISNESGTWEKFGEFTGMKVKDSGEFSDVGEVTFCGDTIPFSRKVRYENYSVGAEILANDSLGYPAISKNTYGKGTVYYVNFPLESQLIEKDGPIEGTTYYTLYKNLFWDVIERHEVRTENPYIGVSIHPEDDQSAYCVLINYTESPQRPELIFRDGVTVEEVYYGDMKEIQPHEAVIFKVRK